MNVKRYVVNDMSEAMNQIKVELGADAIILNTRNVRKKGIIGYFRPPMIEVIAATDSRKNDKDLYSSRITENKYEALLEKKINSLSEQFESLLIKAQDTNKVQNSVEETIYKEDVIFEQTAVPVNTEDVSVSTDVSSSSNEENEYIKKLVASDVKEEIATQVVKEAMVIKEKREDAEISDIIKHLLAQYMGTPKPIKVAKYRRKIIFLVGPTGVGKTTTIAKLAAIFTLKKKAKVCLVTCDTYRIAAVEQLATYADILKIPIEIVRNPGDFNNILAKHEQDDIILVDTAGRSPSDPIKQDEIMPLFNACDSYEVFLVMSATTSYKGAMHILESYKFIDDYKMIFTKVDETPEYGNLINIIYECKKSIGYITIGQNVPDDILEMDDTNTSYIVDKII